MNQFIYREAVFGLQPDVAEGYVGLRQNLGSATLSGLRLIVSPFLKVAAKRGDLGLCDVTALRFELIMVMA